MKKNKRRDVKRSKRRDVKSNKRRGMRKDRKKSVLAAVSIDMRNLSVAIIAAGALAAAMGTKLLIPFSLFLASGAILWLCGILLTAITQK